MKGVDMKKLKQWLLKHNYISRITGHNETIMGRFRNLNPANPKGYYHDKNVEVKTHYQNFFGEIKKTFPHATLEKSEVLHNLIKKNGGSTALWDQAQASANKAQLGNKLPPSMLPEYSDHLSTNDVFNGAFQPTSTKSNSVRCRQTKAVRNGTTTNSLLSAQSAT
eukprot:356814_1